MKIAHIAPPQFEPGIDTGNYKMLLASYLPYPNPKKFFDAGRPRLRSFQILDNGIAEGIVVPFKHVLELAEEYKVDEIVLPDVLRDREGTIKNIRAVFDQVPKNKRVIIPQGEDEKDWWKCFDALEEEIIDSATLGIPKHLDRVPGTRANILNILGDNEFFKEVSVHLFGLCNDPVQEIKMLRRSDYISEVRGIDTGAALAWASRGEVFIIDPFKEHYSLDWHTEYTPRTETRWKTNKFVMQMLFSGWFGGETNSDKFTIQKKYQEFENEE